MKPTRVFLAIVAALICLFLSGCANRVDLVKALANDNAHFKGRITSLYGTIEFERRMEFAPFPPALEAPAPAPRPRKVKSKPPADASTP